MCSRCKKLGLQCSGPKKSLDRRGLTRDTDARARHTLSNIREKLGSRKFRELVAQVDPQGNADVPGMSMSVTEENRIGELESEGIK